MDVGMHMARRAKPVKAKNSFLQHLTASESIEMQSVASKADSVIALGAKSPKTLMLENPLLHVSEARRLADRARSMGILAARRFREHQLSGDMRRAFGLRHGLHALVAAPSYENLFPTDWEGMALPNAVEASTSPLAYLVALYRKAVALEQGESNAFKLLLAERRPDLAEHVLDTAAVHNPCSTLSVVNEVMESAIRRHQAAQNEPADVDQILANTRYPLLLPYERWQDQINEILVHGGHKLTLGELARRTDAYYQYFFRKGVHSPISDAAMQQSAGLGPNRRALLIEAAYFELAQNEGQRSRRSNPRSRMLNARSLLEEQESFFMDNFGVDSLEKLCRTDVFCIHTAIPRIELDALFALETQAPIRSPNVPSTKLVDSSRFGAVFINAASLPHIEIEIAAEPDGSDVTSRLPHTLLHLTEDRADRLNRLIRLSRWMALSFGEADRLVMAAITAEQEEGAAPRMTVNTLRALGVFHDLRLRHGVKPDDFAAWLDQLSPYGQGNEASQFDRVFNAHSLFSAPLILDGSDFDLQLNDEHDLQTVHQICAALGLNQETFHYLGRMIATAFDMQHLQRTLPVVSAFYRITNLAGYLKLHPIVLMALLEILDDGGESLVRQMAGRPVNSTYQVYGYADILSTLVAVVSCVEWCRDNEIDLVWLIQHVRPAVTPTVATDAEHKLLGELRSRLEPVRITPATLLEAGVPTTIEIPDPEEPGQTIEITPNWLDRLADLVDADGVVKDGIAAVEGAYESSAEKIIHAVLDTLYSEPPGPSALREERAARGQGDAIALEKNKIAETILAVVLRARAAQHAVVQESVADYLRLSAELVLPLIVWASQSVYKLLAWSLKVVDGDTGSLLRRARRLTRAAAEDPTDDSDAFEEALFNLAQLSRLARIAQQFKLDAAMLQNHARTWGKDWFGFEPGVISLQTIYYLSLYARIVKIAQQPAEKLLHYLMLVNDPELFVSDPPPTEDQLRLVRDGAAGKLADFLGWGASEILEVAQSINDYGIVTSIVEFDKLLRCYELCRQTGLNARALLQLGELTLQSPDEQYRAAAQNALGSLTATSLGARNGPVAEVGQSVTTTCTVSPERLVARDPDLNNVAVYTLVIKDLRGKPLHGITVRWDVRDAGSLRKTQTITDEDGVTTIELDPGVIMGVARVRARIGLDQDIYAPPVLVDCDEKTLRIEERTRTAPSRKPLAGEKQAIELFVQLEDRHVVGEHGNFGIDRLIHWETDFGRLLQADVHTDREGKARVKLVSRFDGVCTVYAYYGISSARLPPITFVDRPFLDKDAYKLRVTTTALVNEEIVVNCRLLGLSGDPIAGKTINWTIGDGSPVPSTTDADGIARFATTAPSEAGRVRITASYTEGSEGETPDTIAQEFDILSGLTLVALSRLETVAVATPGGKLLLTVRADSDQDRDAPGEGKKPIARYPVTWRRGSGPPETVDSDEAGRSTFAVPLDVPGEFQVSAGTDSPLQFTIRVIAAPQWAITLDGTPIENPSAPLTLRHGNSYHLQVKPAAGQQLTGEELALTWSGPNVIGLGVTSTPMFGHIRTIETDDGLSWDIRCDGGESAQFALGIRLDALGHVTWLTINLLERSDPPRSFAASRTRGRT
jgi:hypothetical protein